MYAKTHFLAAATLILPFASALPTEDSTKPACRYVPGDAGWPSARQWSAFNQSISGRLIAGKPLADSCHGDSFAANTCAPIRETYNQTEIYFPDPVNVMSPLFLKDSCSPYTDPSAPCTLGNLASYAANVSNADDVKAAIKFAKEKNIRLTIKNTGHDYLGRSTGKGALSLWTHNLKDISFLNYTSNGYTGPAIKIGAGVQAYEAYSAAFEHGFRLTGGYCPTVGLSGGWVAAGGTGALGSLYGLGADNTFEYEVVTTEREYLVATPTRNSDLFWALNGGGGGTYGVVISQTTRLHKDGPVAGAELTFTNTGDDKAYWAAVEAWQKQLLVFDTIKGMNTFFGFTDRLFELYFSTLPDQEEKAIAVAFKPFIDTLKKLNVTYTYRTTSQPTYYEHFAQFTPGLPYGQYTTNNLLGGRLIPRATVRDNLPKLMAAFKNITTKNPDHPFRVNGLANNVSHQRVGNKPSDNSVIPQWRDSLYWLNMDVYFDLDGPTSVVDELQKEMNENQNLLKSVTPGSASYINEATYDNPDWKQDYWGANYDKLLAIKNKYDPSHFLYGAASVGSDYWRPDTQERLCKA